MKRSKKPSRQAHAPKDKYLDKIMRQAGAYVHSVELFYQELWRDRLAQIGFRVISVERIERHPVWDIHLCGNLTVQAYFLVSKPMPKRNAKAKDPFLAQVKSEVQEIARDLGQPIKSENLAITRNGRYVRVIFLWAMGKPGLLLKRPRRAEAFPFLIKPWLRKNRN